MGTLRTLAADQARRHHEAQGLTRVLDTLQLPVLLMINLTRAGSDGDLSRLQIRSGHLKLRWKRKKKKQKKKREVVNDCRR